MTERYIGWMSGTRAGHGIEPFPCIIEWGLS